MPTLTKKISLFDESSIIPFEQFEDFAPSEEMVREQKRFIEEQGGKIISVTQVLRPGIVTFEKMNGVYEFGRNCGFAFFYDVLVRYSVE